MSSDVVRGPSDVVRGPSDVVRGPSGVVRGPVLRKPTVWFHMAIAGIFDWGRCPAPVQQRATQGRGIRSCGRGSSSLQGRLGRVRVVPAHSHALPRGRPRLDDPPLPDRVVSGGAFVNPFRYALQMCFVCYALQLCFVFFQVYSWVTEAAFRNDDGEYNSDFVEYCRECDLSYEDELM